jgi:Ion channel
MLMARVYLSWYDLTWLSTAGVDLEKDSLQSQYIQSLYFSITIMATIGFGDITPQNGYERILCIMAMILGTWCYAYCITQLVEMVASWQGADVRFKAHQDNLIEYMRARNLPKGIQRRILNFYEFQRRHAAVFYR